MTLERQKEILTNNVAYFNKTCSDDSECIFFEHIVSDGDKFMLYKGSRRSDHIVIGYIDFDQMVNVIRALELYKNIR